VDAAGLPLELVLLDVRGVLGMCGAPETAVAPLLLIPRELLSLGADTRPYTGLWCRGRRLAEERGEARGERRGADSDSGDGEVGPELKPKPVPNPPNAIPELLTPGPREEARGDLGEEGLAGGQVMLGGAT